MFTAGGTSLHTVNSSPAATAHTEAVVEAPVVQAASVDLRLGGAQVLRGLDLQLHPREVVAVTGPNGSGKSTLLRLLATLLRPSKGRLHLFGTTGQASSDPGVRRRIGYVGHQPGLHPDLTVRENLDFVARLTGDGSDEVERVLMAVGLAGAASRMARVCSEGMRRRVELARILLCRPELLLLDEPHAALDAVSRELVDHVTLDVVGRGGAAVLVTHDPKAVAQLADRVLRLAQGRLVPDELER